MPESTTYQKKSTAGKSEAVLIPVDFSHRNALAVNVGFELARRLAQKVTLLHASIVAQVTDTPQFPDDFNGIDIENEEIEEVEIQRSVDAMDNKSMDALKKTILTKQKTGDFPSVEFNTVNSPGMPEEVIRDYCETEPVSVIVMATRGRQKRHEELIGSVTAEVIDHCVAPVLTVPEDYTFSGFKGIVRICAFCYFDDGDYKCISKLMEMFNHPDVKIFLFPANDKLKGEDLIQNLTNLQKKLETDFENAEFKLGLTGDVINLREGIQNLFVKEKIQMILAPNRKRNIISRFFNPGLPHKILYEIDFPMLAIPV